MKSVSKGMFETPTCRIPDPLQTSAYDRVSLVQPRQQRSKPQQAKRVRQKIRQNRQKIRQIQQKIRQIQQTQRKNHPCDSGVDDHAFFLTA